MHGVSLTWRDNETAESPTRSQFVNTSPFDAQETVRVDGLEEQPAMMRRAPATTARFRSMIVTSLGGVMRRRCQKTAGKQTRQSRARKESWAPAGYFPRILWRIVFSWGQVQRCCGGTLASACSTCRPQPPQVVFPHREHFTGWHMAMNSARKGPRSCGDFAAVWITTGSGLPVCPWSEPRIRAF